METILDVTGVDKVFPGVKALQNVDFDIKAGEIHGLVGHNGAGKSTFVKVITGTYIPEAGEIFLEGEKVVFKSPRDAIQRGIGIVTQEGSLIPSFNGIQNIFLGQEVNKLGIIQEKVLEKKAVELMNYLGVEIDLRKKVEDLSPAQRKIVEILKIININPKIVILDEPTAALSDKERKLLFNVMKKLTKEGIGIIFITHYLDEVFLMCDRITVLRNGENVGTKIKTETTEKEIIRMMINKENHTEYPTKTCDIGDVILEVEDLSDGRMVSSVDLNVHEGEIVGVFGTVGAGRTEMAELIFGANPRTTGNIKIDGKPVKIKKVTDAIKNGLALIPDDRLRKALILEEPIKDNLTIPFLREMSNATIINSSQQCKRSENILNGLSIKAPSINTKVNSLSGGNKQKVSFGKWMSTVKNKPKVYIFDEPTEGVDVGARAEMYKIMVSLAEEGAGCLVISSDISEIIGLSDRIYVMKEGCIVDEVIGKQENINERLIESSLGIK